MRRPRRSAKAARELVPGAAAWGSCIPGVPPNSAPDTLRTRVQPSLPRQPGQTRTSSRLSSTSRRGSYHPPCPCEACQWRASCSVRPRPLARPLAACPCARGSVERTQRGCGQCRCWARAKRWGSPQGRPPQPRTRDTKHTLPIPLAHPGLQLEPSPTPSPRAPTAGRALAGARNKERAVVRPSRRGHIASLHLLWPMRMKSKH
mmetsp:Transcript_11262/g.33356  ORF Transcript_11262/g.33356 Transcript_11262/m.33356 type:complete len:204 (+) Transcript_11262:871-1482(+)